MSEINCINSFHHIGFAVRNLSVSENAFEALGFVFERRYTDIKRNLDFSFGKKKDAGGGYVCIELISSHDTEEKCAVSSYIEKSTCTPYHVCFVVDSLISEIDRLKKLKFRQVGEIIKSDIYGYNASGVFLYSLGTGLIELVSESYENE